MTQTKENLVHVLQGDFAISNNEEDVLTTILGSCVAVCLSDPEARIGGINHFLLPTGGGDGAATSRYGVHAMEQLINGLLKRGAERGRLQAKLFGGAQMIGNMRQIGSENASFAKQFLQDEDIPCLAESLGGRSARRIRFWPTTGRVRQMTVESVDVKEVEPKSIPAPPSKQDITLF